jgi:hypothetical protein
MESTKGCGYYLIAALIVLTIYTGFCASQPSEGFTKYQSTQLCNDSDGGENYYVKGTVWRNANVVWSDVCITPTALQEGYCPHRSSNQLYKVRLVECPYGCFNGACLPREILYLTKTTTTTTTTTTSSSITTTTKTTTTTIREGCVDSDSGADYYVRGIANGANGRKVDRCISPTKLREFLCTGNNVDAEVFDCERGCTQGRCR